MDRLLRRLIYLFRSKKNNVLGSVAPYRVTAREMAAHLAKTIDNDDRLRVITEVKTGELTGFKDGRFRAD
ncbi:MAG: hypothetical protein QOH31_3354 [Verrucomicrobiota bacterium]|jgi:hypothetical protein